MGQSEGVTPFQVPVAFQAARSSLPNEVIVIASWHDEQSHSITIQDFIRDNESFIPVFTSEERFKSQIKGSSFEDNGVFMNSDLLLSMMRGGEHLIVDPGGDAPQSIFLPAL